VRRLNNVSFQDPLYANEWHVHNELTKGMDINVIPAWEHGITGKGVVVTIVDDGVEHDHPDLIDNYDPKASTDLNDNDDDPYPNVKDPINKHGTRYVLLGCEQHTAILRPHMNYIVACTSLFVALAACLLV
jgi:subtilisin family serine protease